MHVCVLGSSAWTPRAMAMATATVRNFIVNLELKVVGLSKVMREKGGVMLLFLFSVLVLVVVVVSDGSGKV